MAYDLATLVPIVYRRIVGLIGDRPVQPGCPPKVDDTLVLTLMLLSHWHGWSERRWLRFLAASGLPSAWLLSQSAYNRRCRKLQPRLAVLLQRLADAGGRAEAPYEIIDVVSVPVVARCRADAGSPLAPLAQVGRGGSDRGWYCGAALMLSVTDRGIITGLTVSSARTEGRWLGDGLITWRDDPQRGPWTPDEVPPSGWKRRLTGVRGMLAGHDTAGQPAARGQYLADRGFVGRHWHAHWRALGVRVITDADYRSPVAVKRHHQRRHRIETINGILKSTFHLARPGARTIAGLTLRILAKCCALNLGIVLNRDLGRPDLALRTLVAV